MINRKNHPIGWAMFVAELADAHEHLGNLIKELATEADYSEENLRIDLGHVYAHLNRAWHRREVHEDLSDSEWDMIGRFPKDLEPIA